MLTENALIDLKNSRRRDEVRIKAGTRLSNQIQAYCRGYACEMAGKPITDPWAKKEGARLFREYLKTPERTPLNLAFLIDDLVIAYTHIRQARSEAEKVMAKLGADLPYADIILGIRGMGAATYATILAEAGNDLTQYATPSCLWKRFGLAVLAGQRQGNPDTANEAASGELWERFKPGTLDKPENAYGLREKVFMAHGYSPKRRAIMAVATENIAVRNGCPEYGKLYRKQKAFELARGFQKGHAHNRALRFCSKRLLLNIWRVWNGQDMLVLDPRDNCFDTPDPRDT